MFGGSGALAVVDLVGSGGRPSLAPAAAASAALQLQAVQWTGEEGELQDKEEEEEQQEEKEEEKETWHQRGGAGPVVLPQIQGDQGYGSRSSVCTITRSHTPKIS